MKLTFQEIKKNKMRLIGFFVAFDILSVYKAKRSGDFDIGLTMLP